MKKIILSCRIVIGFIGNSAKADGPTDGTRDLLNAISLCDTANNPLEGLKKLGGNLFGTAYTNQNSRLAPDFKTITVTAISSPNTVNRAIMASDRQVGVITISMGYESKGMVDRLLVCKMTIQKN